MWEGTSSSSLEYIKEIWTLQVCGGLVIDKNPSWGGGVNVGGIVSKEVEKYVNTHHVHSSA